LVIWPQNHRWTVSLGLGLKTKDRGLDVAKMGRWAAGLYVPGSAELNNSAVPSTCTRLGWPKNGVEELRSGGHAA